MHTSIFSPIIFLIYVFFFFFNNNVPFLLNCSNLHSVSHEILIHTDLAVSHWTLALSAFGFALLPFTSPWQQPFRQVSQESFALALLVIIVYLSCQSPRSPRCSSICMGSSLHVVAYWLQCLAVPMPAFVLCCNNRWLWQPGTLLGIICMV